MPRKRVFRVICRNCRRHRRPFGPPFSTVLRAVNGTHARDRAFLLHGHGCPRCGHPRWYRETSVQQRRSRRVWCKPWTWLHVGYWSTVS